MMKKIVLASGSPRRAELLGLLGVEFRVADKYSVDEVFDATMPLLDVPGYLSRLKSDAYPHIIGCDEILLTADTVVICDGVILGKPKGRSQAIDMLLTLSGNTHTVATAVTLRTSDSCSTFTDTATVTFVELTRAQVEHYVDMCAPYDKAGAYGIQEWIGVVAIERIEGSFYTVMGLPTARLFPLIENW